MKAEQVIDRIESKIEGYISRKTGRLVKRDPETTVAKIAAVLNAYRTPETQTDEEYMEP